MADPIASGGEKRSKRGAKAAAATPDEASERLTKGMAGDMAEPPKAPAEAAGEAVERGAVAVGDQLREAAESLLHEQKERVAEAAHGFADVLRQAAHSFEREQKRMAASYVDQAATQIDRFSETVRRQSLQDMLASAEDIARRQPALFLTGAVAIGFVVGRMLSRSGDGGTPRTQGYAMSAGESSYYHAGAAPQSGAASDPEPS
jgi:ElaB/YqjD/DUF883 family membrane-anchored ribosome-binding protein